MRIAQISPPIERVPPPAYGGIEAVVSLLTEELVRRGHEVTLYATGDSITKARLRAAYPRALRLENLDWTTGPELLQIATFLEEADQFDVVHNHYGPMVMAFSRLVKAPMLTTIHGPMPRGCEGIWERYTGGYNSISRAGKSDFPDRGYLGVVYNGIDVASFPYRPMKESFLLFLGRVSPEKGTHLAIDAARSLGRRLIIAGKIDRVDRAYWETEIQPRIDGDRIQFVGEADGTMKRNLYARASCLLHPVTWPEPFGLVMAEAMACGTPVVAIGKGSIPEVVADGETGFVVNDADEMAEAIERIDKIDPAKCRARVERLFSTEQMVDGYEKLYQTLLS